MCFFLSGQNSRWSWLTTHLYTTNHPASEGFHGYVIKPCSSTTSCSLHTIQRHPYFQASIVYVYKEHALIHTSKLQIHTNTNLLRYTLTLSRCQLEEHKLELTCAHIKQFKKLARIAQLFSSG